MIKCWKSAKLEGSGAQPERRDIDTYNSILANCARTSKFRVDSQDQLGFVSLGPLLVCSFTKGQL